MKKHFYTLVALALLVAGSFGSISLPAYAQGLPEVKILIIDFQRVTSESLVGKDVQAQIRQQTSKISTWESNMANALNEERQEIERQQTIIAPDAYQERVQGFQQRGQAANNQLQLLRNNMQSVAGEAQLEIERVLQPIVNKLMTERGATIVLNKLVVWHSASGFDVTTTVIDRLNAELPSYRLSFMAIPATPGAE